MVKQYGHLFEMDHIALTFEPAALEAIADKALEFKLGARGLRSICEAILTDAMYELPESVTVTAEMVEQQLSKADGLKAA